MRVTQDDFGMLPLHLSCFQGGNPRVINALITAFPDGIKVADCNNKTPLNHANAGLHPNQNKIVEALTAIKKMVEDAEIGIEGITCFDAANRVNKELSAGQCSSALLTLIDSRQRDKAMQVLDRYAEKSICNGATVWTKTGNMSHHCLPIHRACALKAPANLIEALIRSYPVGSSCTGSHGMTPLHFACQNGANLSVVDLLLEAFPDAAFAQDKFGLLPLHVACTEGARLEVVQAIATMNPDAAESKDDAGHTPLDYTRLSLGPGSEAIQKLLENMTSVRNNLGKQLQEQMQEDNSRLLEDCCNLFSYILYSRSFFSSHRFWWFQSQSVANNG